MNDEHYKNTSVSAPIDFSDIYCIFYFIKMFEKTKITFHLKCIDYDDGKNIYLSTLALVSGLSHDVIATVVNAFFEKENIEESKKKLFASTSKFIELFFEHMKRTENKVDEKEKTDS